jgi:hypothetical protein
VGFQEGTTTAQADTGPTITNTPTIDGLPALVDLPSGRLIHATAGVRSTGEGKYDHCGVATALANLIIPRVRNQ